MSSSNSSFGLSYLDPSEVEGTPSGRRKQSTFKFSTPKDTKASYPQSDLSPIDISELTNTSTPQRSQKQAPNSAQSSASRKSNRSILKQYSPNKYSTPKISESVMNSHPELNMAMSQQGTFNPVKGARVLFSPTKEIRTYLEDHHHSHGPSEYHDMEEEDFDNHDDELAVPLDGGDEENDDDAAAASSGVGGIFSSRRRKSTKPSSSALSSPSRGGGGGAANPPPPPPSSFFVRHFNAQTPYVLSLYLQFAFNLVIISLITYFIFIFVKTIKSDINRKVELYTTEIVEEISSCTREYYRNKCTPDQRAPKLEKICTSWQKCMNRDPDMIARSRITAETFADILNGFIRPISWKSLIFLNLLVWGSLVATNTVFGGFRASNHPAEEENAKLQEKVRALEEERSKLLEQLKAAEQRDQAQLEQRGQSHSYMQRNLVANNSYMY